MFQSLSADLSCLIVCRVYNMQPERDIAAGMVASTHSVVPNPQVRSQSAVSITLTYTDCTFTVLQYLDQLLLYFLEANYIA